LLLRCDGRRERGREEEEEEVYSLREGIGMTADLLPPNENST